MANLSGKRVCLSVRWVSAGANAVSTMQAHFLAAPWHTATAQESVTMSRRPQVNRNSPSDRRRHRRSFGRPRAIEPRAYSLRCESGL